MKKIIAASLLVGTSLLLSFQHLNAPTEEIIFYGEIEISAWEETAPPSETSQEPSTADEPSDPLTTDPSDLPWSDEDSDEITTSDEIDPDSSDEQTDSSDGSSTTSGDESIEETLVQPLEALLITPFALVTSGNITIDIPTYNPAEGWLPGPIDATKDATINVNFGSTPGTDKRIRIQLAEGFRFVKYPVLTIQYSDREVLADNELHAVIESVSSKPQKQTAYATYNSGYLEYKITSTTTQVEIKNISFTVDEIVYYGSDAVLTGAIRISTLVDGVETNELKMDIKQSNNPVTLLSYRTDYSFSVITVPDATFQTPPASFLRHGFLWNKYNFYYKSLKIYFYYPKELWLVSATSTWSAHYPASGLVVFTAALGPRLTFSTSGVLPGIYMPPIASYIEVEMYDGTIIHVNANTSLSQRQVTVQDPSLIPNKLALGVAGRRYDTNLWSDYWIQGPGLEVYNPDGVAKTDQVMEFRIGTGYEVRQVSFPFATNVAPATVERSTRSGITGTAVGNQIIKTYNTTYPDTYYGRGISTASLGLASGEYLSYAKAPIGTFTQQGTSGNSHYSNYITSPMHVMGRLASTAASATVNVQTRAGDGSGGVQSGSHNSITGTITKNLTNPYVYFYAKNASMSVTAGQTATQTVYLRENDSISNLNDHVAAFVNPTIYIRKPAGVHIYSGSITVNEMSGGAVPFTISEYTTTQGAEVIAIHISKQIWFYFDGVYQSGVELNFDYRVNLETVGSIYWHDYVLFNTPFSVSYQQKNGSLGQLNDTYDVNNNGNITERMMGLNTSTTQIIASNVLLMDTYLIPDGGTRQPSYDPAQPATATAFTPGTVGKYEVVFDNQRNNTVGSLVYLPLPKEGNNFGVNFQSTGFSRNMKLWGQPSITVYDQFGNNVTASRAVNYEIRYSSNATNASNYETATYTTNYSGATMIRMQNNLQMLPGEKVVLSFDYIVDESNSSSKVWLINDFMPYYYFEAGNIGWTNGSRVGAKLQVGSIGGMIFLDENVDGLYSTGETKLTNVTVKLYKDSTLFATTLSDSNGTYFFTGLTNGIYKVDFNAALSTYPHFTFKGSGDMSLASQVEYLGVDVGYALNIDPVQLSSTTINAGVLKYQPSTDLKAILNTSGFTMIITSTGSTPTTGLQSTILPAFFNQIQSVSNAITRTSSNPSVATVSATGWVEGHQAWTTTITLTIRDLWGNTTTATALVTVENKIPLSCTVDYAPLTNTNGNVIATLSNCNKPVTVTNTSFTPCQGGASEVSGGLCVFTGNGSFTFQFQDAYGNTGSAPANVTRIDKTPIIPTVSYSITWWTNQDVVATISFNKSWVTITNTSFTPCQGGASEVSGGLCTFTTNGSFTFTYEDAYGNRGTEPVVVSRIDKVAPTCSLTYNPNTNTNGNVIASLTGCSESIIVTNNPNINYSFTGNGSFTFQFRDQAGNTWSQIATVTRIDASAIQATIVYTPPTPTSGNVVAGISFNKTWVTIINTSFTPCQGGASEVSGGLCTFTDNGNFTFTYQDTYANTGSAVALVNWIDRIAPTCDVAYSTTGFTNNDVIATLVNCSETITGPTTHTFTGNGSYTFNFLDHVGNTGSRVANVSRIDKTSIVGTISYSTTGATSGDVIATISFNKSWITLTNTSFTPCQGGASEVSGGLCTFTGNGNFSFTFSDVYGNQGSETALVSRIDKTPPSCSVSYNPATNTNQDVVATLVSCSEAITGITSHTFTGNDTFTFNFSDLVGNTGSAVATVNRIDKISIIPTLSYSTTGATNGNVVATISFNKSWVTVINNGASTSYTFTANGNFTFTYGDAYGNTGSVIATVNRIDKTAPVLTLTYLPATPTNQDVLVTLTTNEPVTAPLGRSWAATGTVFTRLYTGNITEPVTVYDLVGNQGQRWLLIDRIDKTPVTGSVSYSTTTATSGNVIATISFNKAGVTVTNNGGSASYVFTSDGTFTFAFTDAAGNTGSETATVSWITGAVSTPTTPSIFPSTSGRWGGGGILKKDDCPNGDFSPSYYDKDCGDTPSDGIPLWCPNLDTQNTGGKEEEVLSAYTRAYAHNITTLKSLEIANPEGLLIRSDLAKMMTNYAIGILHMNPDLTKDCSTFLESISQYSNEMKKYMTLSCQLEIMGIHQNKTPLSDFMPDKHVTRAEFWTILSRLLYGTTYDEGTPYYLNHLHALHQNGIMTQITNPEQRREQRQRVRLMLMKTSTSSPSPQSFHPVQQNGLRLSPSHLPWKQ